MCDKQCNRGRSGYAVVVFCQSRKAAAGLELKVYHHRGGKRRKKRKFKTYLLFDPRQLAFKLLLLVEQSLVFSAQRRKTFRKLICKLRNILLYFINHGCVSQEQKWGCGSKSLGRDQLRLRGEEAALSVVKRRKYQRM